jgi:hypothetical protein
MVVTLQCAGAALTYMPPGSPLPSEESSNYLFGASGILKNTLKNLPIYLVPDDSLHCGVLQHAIQDRDVHGMEPALIILYSGSF